VDIRPKLILWETTMTTRPRSLSIAAVVAAIFGGLTILSGGIALFGGVNMGAVVPFVLWFNFLAGFAYAAAGWGLWTGQRWAPGLSIAIAAATAVVFAAFLWKVWQGGAHEARTTGAMVVRLAVWLIISALALRQPPPR
jgi:hypothetical protein